MCFAVQLLYFELDAGVAMKNGNEAHFTVVYNRVFSFVLKYVHGYVLRVSAVGERNVAGVQSVTKKKGK